MNTGSVQKNSNNLMKTKQINSDAVDIAAVRAAVASYGAKLQDDTLRGIRALLDLGCQFTHSATQNSNLKRLLSTVNKRRSQYPRLIRNLFNQLDRDTLLTVGINFGYFSLSHGAKTIRAKSSECECQIPWCMFIRLSDNGLRLPSASLSKIVEESVKAGIHTFWLYLNEGMMDEGLCELIKSFSDCLFIVFTNPERINQQFCDSLRQCKNSVVGINVNDGSDYSAAAELLMYSRIMYGAHIRYCANDVERITNGDIISSAAQNGCAYVALERSEAVDGESLQRIRDYIIEMQRMPSYPVFMFDLYDDIQVVNNKISGNNKCLEIEADGRIQIITSMPEMTGCNINESNLLDVCKAV